MRRIASALISSLAIATLAACSGGGYGVGTSAGTVPQSVQFSGSSAMVNDFTISPAGNLPIQVTATGFTGSGTTATVVPFATFTWQAGYAPKGTVFYKGASPNGSTACGTPSETPAVPVLESGNLGGNFSAYGGAYSILPAQQTANTVFLGVPRDSTTLAFVQPATGSTNYCLVLDAFNSNKVLVGGQIVVVTNSAP